MVVNALRILFFSPFKNQFLSCLITKQTNWIKTINGRLGHSTMVNNNEFVKSLVNKENSSTYSK